MDASPRFAEPFMLVRLKSGDTDWGEGRAGVVGTVLGISRSPGGLVSYAPENPLTRGGSCVGAGGSAYQLFLCGGRGSKARVGWGGGTEG